MDWHVLHLKPRCEKKMAGYCVKLELAYYLPLRRETKVYQRRKVTVEKPVFPGYFFAAFDRAGRLSLLRSNYIVRLMEVPDRRAFLHQLAQVRRALRADPTLVSSQALTRGRRVRITGGPFRGVEGTVRNLKGVTTVCLNVEMIGQAVVVEVEKEWIETTD